MSRRTRETATAVNTTSTDPTSSVELDVTKNMVEPFRMFSFSSKSYMESDDSNIQFQFNAAHVVLQQVPFGTDEKLHVPSCHYGDDNLIRSLSSPSQDINARQGSEAGQGF